MSKYDLFRNRIRINKKLESKRTANFIENSLSSTKITHVRLEKEIPAVFTREQREGNDEVILFTYVDQNPEHNLQVGDYVLHNTKRYLVYMEYDKPLNDYLKFKLLECNILIKVDGFTQPAAYFSSLRRFTQLTNNKIANGAILQEENQSPVVITADNPMLTPNFRFLAATEPFKVLTIDRISNQGIAYMSVEQTTINHILDDVNESSTITEDKQEVDKPEIERDYLKRGETVTWNTFGNRYTFIPHVSIINRTKDTVTFIVPFDAVKITMKLENSEGNITEIIKEVKN